MITTPNTRQIYKLITSVALSINYNALPDGDPVLVIQFTKGWQQITNEQIKRAMAKATRESAREAAPSDKVVSDDGIQVSNRPFKKQKNINNKSKSLYIV